MSAAKKGTVYLVGAGPGDPELLTVKASRLLASCDVVLHDDLVPAAVLSVANRRAWILNVGKRCGSKRVTQEEINFLMIDQARKGQCVVRLKIGDPLVFGRAAEEMDALREAGVACEVVPGITAAFAAAASIQCSLTDRRSASSVLFSSGHHANEPEPQPRATHDATRVVYMPGRDLAPLASEWRREGLPESLPCIVVSRAAQPDQQAQRTTLHELSTIEPGPTPVLVLAGSALANAVLPASVDLLFAAALSGGVALPLPSLES
ncbi:MAG TPA: uroporphyrinogen-III C-methyltransferase [Acidisarcina sp.]|nr:uroporphyrinogen-III C-methyltransferase [Acidisarcina sp.]